MTQTFGPFTDREVGWGAHRASEPEQQTSRDSACDAPPALSRQPRTTRGDDLMLDPRVPDPRDAHEAICLRHQAIARWREHAAAGRCEQSMADEAVAALLFAIGRIERGEQ